MSNDKTWTKERLDFLINSGTEENFELEYKAAAKVKNDEACKDDISKYVSAFANSNGGTIIFGLKEPKDGNPATIDPIEFKTFNKEWMDQVIHQTQPPIKGITITPIETEAGKGVYAVNIPKSNTAHQARDKRYHRRRNTTIDAMHDYEIRDIMNRRTLPDIEVSIYAVSFNNTEGRDQITFGAILTNIGGLFIKNWRVTINVPSNTTIDGKSVLLSLPSDGFTKQNDIETTTFIFTEDTQGLFGMKAVGKNAFFPETRFNVQWFGYIVRLPHNFIDDRVVVKIYADDMKPKMYNIKLSSILNGQAYVLTEKHLVESSE